MSCCENGGLIMAGDGLTKATAKLEEVGPARGLVYGPQDRRAARRRRARIRLGAILGGDTQRNDQRDNDRRKQGTS
jgi:hypothetical protein